MKQLNIHSKPIKQEGYLLPWNKETENPCLIDLEGVTFVPVFSTKKKLDEHLAITDYKHEVSIKRIDDTDEFLESVLPYYRVMLDPWVTEYSTTRFTELRLPRKMPDITDGAGTNIELK
jgi:hypothetical protein